LSVISLSVEVGKYGRIVLPKDVRKRYKINEGSRLIIRERKGEIILIPVRRYEKPTEALYGSIEPGKPIDEPKRIARGHIKQKLSGEIL